MGTPNLGAPKAYKVLIAGDNFTIQGLSDSEMKFLAQNMPVVYDLAADQNYYNLAGSPMTIHFDPALGKPDTQDTLTEMTNQLENNDLINSLAMSDSQVLHDSLDNLDISSTNVDTYNIIGCKTGTFGSFTANLGINNDIESFDFPKITPGDGTVPLLSAKSINASDDHTFYAPGVQHSSLLSADGPMQEIVNIVSGSNLDVGKVVSQSSLNDDPSQCQLKKGKFLGIFSPVSISITDQEGQISQVLDDGSIENDIPGADYEVWGEHKYIYLPTDAGQQYSIELTGTGTGTFTLKDEDIEDNNVTGTEVFSNLPVTTSLKGQVVLADTSSLELDNNGDGVFDQTLLPTSVVNGEQSDDITPPITSADISGIQGQPNYFRSNVAIKLSAQDFVDPAKPNQTSGMLNTHFSLDGSEIENYQVPITVSSEGAHTIRFFSTDRAGNNEPEQTINFVVDKTAPEFSIQFDPSSQDIKFTGTDNLTPAENVSLQDNDDQIIISDQAGNTSEIILSSKDRKKKMTAEIEGLLYNGVAADLSKNKFSFSWQYDKQGQLKKLTQSAQDKKNFRIDATFDGQQTRFRGNGNQGKINELRPGLVSLKIRTQTGDLMWSY